MADGDGGGGASRSTTLTEAVDAVSKVLPTWPGDAGGDVSVPELGDKPSEASASAARARAKYDATVRWVLGTFGAIGLLVFGSAPFADVDQSERPALYWVGLTLAGLGLLVVIYATTRALEPQIARLGELKTVLDRTSARSLKVWRRPIEKANRDLKQRLTGDEREAHLGPGVQSVQQLILRLKQLEREVLAAETGANFNSCSGLGSGDSNAARRGQRALVDAEISAARDVTLELYGKVGDIGKEQYQSLSVKGQAQERFFADAQSYRMEAHSLRERRPQVTPAEIRLAGRAAAKATLLTTYRAHRALLLDEALVAQLRGTFRFFRNFVLVGGLLTLIGGVLYVGAVKADKKGEGQGDTDSTSQAPRSFVEATFRSGTPAWNTIGDSCQRKPSVRGLLLDSDDTAARRDGPFVVQLIDPACAFKVSVPAGGGTYIPSP